MFAVIKTGGKQYKVAADDMLRIERVAGEAGSKVEIDSVLIVGDDSGLKVGSPYVEGARVTAEIVEQVRDGKVLVFKKKRRKSHRRLNGHRQALTLLRITEILPEGAPKAKTKSAAKAAEQAPAEAKETEPKTGAEAKEPEAKKPAAKKAAPKRATPKVEAKSEKKSEAKAGTASEDKTDN